MESWRMVWREGFVKILGVAHLEALRQALLTDDIRLTQGSTTMPPPLMSMADWEPEAACAIGYCGWKGDGLKTVGEVERFFSTCCFNADIRLEENGGSHWFLNWFDDMPRREVIEQLLPEVDLALAQKR